MDRNTSALSAETGFAPGEALGEVVKSAAPTAGLAGALYTGGLTVDRASLQAGQAMGPYGRIPAVVGMALGTAAMTLGTVLENVRVKGSQQIENADQDVTQLQLIRGHLDNGWGVVQQAAADEAAKVSAPGTGQYQDAYERNVENYWHAYLGAAYGQMRGQAGESAADEGRLPETDPRPVWDGPGKAPEGFRG